MASLTNWIKAAAGSAFPPEAGRYHLYVSFACPYASRCLFAWSVKGLQDVISVTIVSPIHNKTSDKPEDTHRGWFFAEPTDEFPECSPDPVFHAKHIRELYGLAGSDTTKFSVPVLVDKQTRTIVNNESAQIVRMFNSEFNQFAAHPEVDLYPESLRAAIDAANEWVDGGLSSALFKTGMATTQQAYEDNVKTVFELLDKAEDVLSKQRFLVSNEQITESDMRLLMSLWRFDEVFHVLYKCNKKRLSDYPNLSNYARDVSQQPGVDAVLNMKHIKNASYRNQLGINPNGVVPVGPGVNFFAPHDRARFATQQ